MSRRALREGGFTIVELAVALAVIGVLLGIALPTFLGTRAGADDSAAKSAAMAGLKAHLAAAQSGSGGADLDSIRAEEPNIDIAELPAAVEDAPEVLGRVYLRAEADTVILVSKSRTGRCFWARSDQDVATFAEGDCTDEPVFSTSW